MGSEGPSKRPFCNHCSKPLRTCLCSRLTSPPIDNSIAITVLQHNLEKRHPLNSIRIAKLGLRNLSIISISDVNLYSRLLIRPLNPYPDDPNLPKRLDFGKIGECRAEEQGEKCRIIWYDGCISIRVDRGAKPNMKSVLASPIGEAAISHGFTVKKIQTKQTRGSIDKTEDIEEYEIMIPAGSALLYPGYGSMALEAVDFDVKHLIVLDGTWGKARRMYSENPWLELMPRLRLDWKRESLYSEVRHEPKAGCLSTIESIVCSLKTLQGGKEEEKLDQLLTLFESMVGDQRRLKDEKFKRMV